MHLSVIRAARGHEADAARQWEGGPFAEHDWLWRSLCGAPNTTPDCLFRRWDLAGTPRLFALTSQKPLPQNSVWEVTTRDYAPRLAAGTRVRFHVRANPTVMETRDGRSQRQDVVTRAMLRLLGDRGYGSWEEWVAPDRPSYQSLIRETCCEWLHGRAARHGFSLHGETLCAESYCQHEQDDSRTQLVRQRADSGVPFSTVDLSGELTVVDPVTFGFALQRGIGRAKPFGCGLLLLDDGELSRSPT
jgi:CRISPR system Cascade subunit CasE